MVGITYVEHDGTEHRVEVAVGLTVMRGARDNDVPGILADCGGACACGTCRVFVAEAFRDIVGGPNAIEEAVLDIDDSARPGKRLACQINVTEALDGLIVYMPARQF